MLVYLFALLIIWQWRAHKKEAAEWNRQQDS
jgi:hypothetical protein